jgi:hypothetical protein
VGNTSSVGTPNKGIRWDAVPLGTRPDAAFARELGVAVQVVHRARTRRGIGRFQTPSQKRREAVDWETAGLGERPDRAIAIQLGPPTRMICAERRKRGIPPFVGLTLTQEGAPCRSIYEAMYDAHLHEVGQSHEHEVHVPGLPYVADFRVAGLYVEIAAMRRFARYERKYLAKRRAYERCGLPVTWLTERDVEAVFAGCAVTLRFRVARQCEDCEIQTHDLVKGVCRRCYMHRWRRDVSHERACDSCCRPFMASRDARFCSRACYWQSLELAWPSWKELDALLVDTSIAAVARDLGVNPSTLYMRLRRRQRSNGSF